VHRAAGFNQAVFIRIFLCTVFYIYRLDFVIILSACLNGAEALGIESYYFFSTEKILLCRTDSIQKRRYVT